MNSEPSNEYLNVRETARFLQVHENTVRNWAANGVLKSAKLPGARAHRFERSEVERLQRDRGASASSVARPLRQDGPELVGPFDLDSWAARDDAKTAFPELMDRLLSATPGVTNVNVRSHEGTSAHGWDGTATSRGTAFLPKGKLYFEFGTNEKPEVKADDDYEHREGKLADPKKGIFVFATPKNWPGAAKWSTGKQGLNEYASVEAYDAHRLASWIRTIPSVHYWISERLGYAPRDAQTLESWFSSFRDDLTLQLPGAFFIAGRSEASKSLIERLTAASDSLGAVTVKASDEVEALAFIFGALENSDLLSSVIVVHKREGWDRIVDSDTPSILVPMFEKPAIAKAMRIGHRVILLAGSSHLVSPNDIKLPRIDPLRAGEAMDKATDDFSKARRLVALGRRDMPAFLRSVSRDQRLPKPTWSTDSTRANILAPLVLTSTWSNTDADHEVLTRLTSKTWPEIERTLKSLEREGHPLFVASGTSWQLGAPKEASRLLLDQLVSADVESWGEIAREVLLSPDPYLGMDYSARLQAQFEGTRPKYSAELRRGIALSLALVASSDLPSQPGLILQDAADQILRSLWQAASEDTTGALWGSLSDEMPLLAEASPRAFLDAVEEDLDRGHPLLVTLFQDQNSDGPFGASSPHTGLLWALETLCWSPDFFRRAAEALARLTEVDPGGKLSNRPATSLINVLLGWVRQSGATSDEKLEFLAFLTETMPQSTWQLLVGLLPESHAFSMPPHAPTYRDWAKEPSGVSLPIWARYVSGIVELAIGLSTGVPSRWVELIDKYEELPPQDRVKLLAAIREDLGNTTWTPNQTHSLWQVLDEKIQRHREFATADWALPSDELAALQVMADEVASDSDPRRHIGLFEWHRSFQGMHYGDDGFDGALSSAQTTALIDVAGQGIEALKSLAQAVKNKQAMGWQLAVIPDAAAFDSELISWLGLPDEQLRGVGRAFVQNRIRTEGWSWVKSVYPIASHLEDDAKQLFASSIPFSREYWLKLDSDAPELVDAFWSQGHLFLANGDEYVEAVDRLLGANHPWAAIAVISNYLHSETPDLETVKKALANLITTSEPMVDRSMSPYYVENLLKFMERVAPDDPDLPRYEFALFGLLHDKSASRALYRALNDQPDDFIMMIRALFRAEGAERREANASEKRFANRAWEILHAWRNIPGQRADGTIDSDTLQEWVRAARFAFEESGHTSVGDEQIGEILSASPTGEDGIWPAEAVREVVEATGSVRLETGLQIGLFNRRGVTTRSPYEGGAQERALQEKYHQMSVSLAPKWRRTGRVLAAIAESYGQDARREDERAEREADRE